MSLAYCDFDEQNKIATVVINRPDVLNALDVPTSEALRDAVVPLADRSDIRCIVLRGAGRAFIAGGDVAKFAEDFDKTADVVEELLNALEEVVHVFQAHTAPVLASVHGAVAGAGLSLMAACDLVVAEKGTRFLIAYDKVAATPDCSGSYFLPRLLGERRAASLMLLGETWSAEQALDYGLVNRLAEQGEIEQLTNKLATQLASGPTQAFGQYKKLIREGRSRSLREQLDAEREAFCALTKTDDFKEGVTSFLERRKADYKGS